MEDLIAGKDKVIPVYIKSLDGDVNLRPLGLDEISKAQGQALTAMKVSADTALDKGAIPGNAKLEFTMKGLIMSEAESQLMLAQMGLSCAGKNWKMDDVKKIRPSKAVEEIAEAVLEISGAGKGVLEQLKPFREIAERAIVNDLIGDGPQIGDKDKGLNPSTG